jgi:hypothetical protein
MRTLVWQQRHEGLAVFEGMLKATVTRLGELVNIGSQVVPDAAWAAAKGTPDYRELIAAPAVSASKAVAVAGQEIGDRVTESSVRALGPPAEGPEKKQAFKAALLTEAAARLLWVPLSAEAMRPAWEVVTVSKARGEMYRVLVDAGTAEVLVRQSLTEYISDASYRVFTGESPTPMQPTHASVSLLQPAAGSRSLIVTSAFNTTASPNGWRNPSCTRIFQWSAFTSTSGNPYFHSTAKLTPATHVLLPVRGRQFEKPLLGMASPQPAVLANISTG